VAAPDPVPAGTHTPDALELLRRGTLEVTGRIMAASNATLLCAVELDGVSGSCVYKPVRGERPLWDFPDGTLAGREVASYLVSEATGWAVIPPTVLRGGPYGPGMVQLWIDTPGATLADLDEGQGESVEHDLVVEEERGELIDLCPPDQVPDGWRPVLRAHDYGGDVVVLAHADDDRLRRSCAAWRRRTGVRGGSRHLPARREQAAHRAVGLGWAAGERGGSRGVEPAGGGAGW